MFVESTVDLSVPLGDFEVSYIEVEAEVNEENDGDGNVQEIDEVDYDARVGRTVHCTVTEEKLEERCAFEERKINLEDQKRKDERSGS